MYICMYVYVCVYIYIYIYVQLHAAVAHDLGSCCSASGVFRRDFRLRLQEAALAALTAEKAAAEKAGPRGMGGGGKRLLMTKNSCRTSKRTPNYGN